MKELGNITVTNIKEIMTVKSQRGIRTNITNRKTYGLSFCESGRIIYTHKGKNYVANPSVAVILPRGESYSLYWDKSGSFPVINFTCEEFICDTVKIIPIAASEPYIKDYERIKELFLFENSRAKIMSIFYSMLHSLSLENAEKSAPMGVAVAYIEKNYDDPELTNEAIAKECRISEVYFRKLFTESFNVSPRQYIIDIRINKAKQLLCDGVMKISSVSEACGFSNPYHFTRTFKERVGVTPSEYMKQNRSSRI